MSKSAPISVHDLTVVNLRERAKALGLKGYSKLTRPKLLDLLEEKIVHRGDPLVRKLGETYLRTCKVHGWDEWRKHYKPNSWLVPAFKLDGIKPLSWREICAARALRAEKREQTRVEREKKYRELCFKTAKEIGASPDGELVKSYIRGDVDADLARLIAFKNRLRHEYSDYEDLLSKGYSRQEAREERVDFDSPDSWDHYLKEYRFDCETSKRLSEVLEDPGQCHPAWFMEAVIAIKRSGIDLSLLTYEKIRDAIKGWRNSRYHDESYD